MQIFASDEETIQENLSVISNIDDCVRYYESQDNRNHDDHNGDEDSEKDGIDEDWMFGKIKSKV